MDDMKPCSLAKERQDGKLILDGANLLIFNVVDLRA